MQNRRIWKGVVVGILLLLIAASLGPSIIGMNSSEQTVLTPDMADEEKEAKQPSIQHSWDSDWWVRYQHDMQSTGYSTSRAPSRFMQSWTWEFDFYPTPYGEGLTSPVVAYDKVFVGVTMDWARPPLYPRDHRLVCFDMYTGEMLWDYILGEWSMGYKMSVPPTVYKDRVYAGCIGKFGAGKMICLDISDGTEHWNYTIDRPVAYSPIVVGNKVYFGARSWNQGTGLEGVYCLDAKTGEEIWVRLATPQDPVYPNLAQPVYYDGKIYVTTGTTDWFARVFCLDAETGEIIWRHSRTDHAVNTFIRSSPVIYDGKWYNTMRKAGQGHILYCLDAQGNMDGTTTLLWETPLYDSAPRDHPVSPAAANGYIYVGAPAADLVHSYVYCYDAQTGQMVWHSPVEYPISPEGFAVADGKLYFGTINNYLPYEGNYIYCMDASNGNILWKFHIVGSIWTSPAIARGRVYVSALRGPFSLGSLQLYCFGGTSPSADAVSIE